MLRSLLVLLISLSMYSAAIACTPSSDEQQIWDGIQSSHDPGDFDAYLTQYPNGCFKAVAVFKLKRYLPEVPQLRVSVRFTGTGFKDTGNGEKNTNGNGAPVERFSLNIVDIDQKYVMLQYECDAAGVPLLGLSGWVNEGNNCHPGAVAAIQGFAVRIIGPLAKYYTLVVQCRTIHRALDPTSSLEADAPAAEHKQGSGEWCGVHAGTPREYVDEITISLRTLFK